MTLEDKIKRINELYHKSKAEGLTEEEKAEQAALRAEYVANIRNENVLYSRTYNELSLTNIDFSINKDANTINFKNEVSKVVSAVYDNIKQKLLPLIIIITMIIGVNSYFISVLFIAALYKLLYGYLRLSFGKVFKAIYFSGKL